MVNEQYRMLVVNVDERKSKKMISAQKLIRDYASPTYKNNTTGIELSVATQREQCVMKIIPLRLGNKCYLIRHLMILRFHTILCLHL